MIKLAKTIIIAGILVISIEVFSDNRSIEFEQGLWSEVLAKAKEQNKIIFLDAYASWCGPCKWMTKNVFVNDTVADYYNDHFINVKLDMEKGEGIEIAAKYNIHNYPTLMYLDAEGTVLHRKCGSQKTKPFIVTGEEALDSERRLLSYKTRFDSGDMSSDLTYQYLIMLKKACLPYDTEVGTYFNTQTDENLTQEYNWKIIREFLDDHETEAFQYLENNKEKFTEIYKVEEIDKVIKNAYAKALSREIRKKEVNMRLYNAIKNKAKNSHGSMVDQLLLEADMKLSKKNKNWEAYANLAVECFDKYPSDNWKALNREAWTFYEHVTNTGDLQKAVEWIKKSIELESNYYNHDTYAALLYKLGQKQEAIQAAEKAIEVAKDTEHDYSETEKLLENIRQSL